MRRAERGEAPRGSAGPKRSVARSSPTRPDAARPNAEGGRRSGIPEGHPRRIQTLTSRPSSRPTSGRSTDDALVRTVTENARTLKFKSQGFEGE